MSGLPVRDIKISEVFLAVCQAVYLGLWTEACHLIIILCHSHLWQEALGRSHVLCQVVFVAIYTITFPQTVDRALGFSRCHHSLLTSEPLPGMCRRP